MRLGSRSRVDANERIEAEEGWACESENDDDRLYEVLVVMI